MYSHYQSAGEMLYTVCDLRRVIPPMVVKAEKIDFRCLCNDLIDYFIVCFEHQCNTMRAF